MQIEYRKCTKLFSGCGVASLLGVLSYEAYRTYAALSSLVDTRVLDIDRKRPDYIYIKHHIYRQSLRERALDAENQHRLLNIIVQPFEKWWKALKHSVAWRLLRIAQRGDQAERLKAIHQLAQIDHLKDWDFQHLAQLCDYRTAISLARSNCDTRWFLPPRQYGVEKEMREVLVEMKSLLELLAPHKCAAYALEQTFGSSGHIREPDGDEVTYQMSPSRFEYDQLKQSLSALVHLTGLVGPEGKQHCRRIVDAGGLLMLLEAEKLFREDIDMKLLISRLVGNLSACEGLGYEFYASGWIGILARWKRDVDMRMQVTADLTLENLDQDDPNGFRYAPKVYPLHPRGRQQAKPAVDVVFIHGLLGGVFVTWRQKDLKPQAASLLGKKHKDVHLVSTSSPSFTSLTNDIAPTDVDIPPNRTGQRTEVAYAARTYKSWSARKSSFEEEDHARTAEEGITAYKDELLTGVAKLKQHTSALVWPSVEVQELEENSTHLLHLNKSFLRSVDSLGVRRPKIITLCEGKPTVLTSFKLAIHVVPESSARIDAGDFYLTSEDHLNLSKPICRQSFLYQRLVGAIQEAIRSGGPDSVKLANVAQVMPKAAQQQLIFHGTKKSAGSTAASSALSGLYTQLKQFEQLMNVFI
uniref:Protein SERAC1 n=1 Tax=Anopheles coluzzii TaxID=1518534 RepID=A0A8W7NZ19_ANOCL